MLRNDWGDQVGDAILLFLVHEARGEEVLDVKEGAVLVGEVGGEAGDVTILVEDEAAAQQTSDSGAQVVRGKLHIHGEVFTGQWFDND